MKVTERRATVVTIKRNARITSVLRCNAYRFIGVFVAKDRNFNVVYCRALLTWELGRQAG